MFFDPGSRDSEGLRSMMVVDVKTDPTFAAGNPRELFKGTGLDYHSTAPLTGYDVTPDGQRLLMVRTVSQPQKAVTQVHIVLNWHQELLEMVPVK